MNTSELSAEKKGAKQGSKTELALQKAARGGEADWMVAARTGLHLLLRAKIDPSLRQAVLGVTAAYAQLASPSWLWVSTPSLWWWPLHLYARPSRLVAPETLTPD